MNEWIGNLELVLGRLIMELDWNTGTLELEFNLILVTSLCGTDHTGPRELKTKQRQLTPGIVNIVLTNEWIGNLE